MSLSVTVSKISDESSPTSSCYHNRSQRLIILLHVSDFEMFSLLIQQAQQFTSYIKETGGWKCFLIPLYSKPDSVCVCMCKCSCGMQPDVPPQTSYQGRCSSLHLLWSCSKPWRSPVSNPGLDQSSIHLQRGSEAEKHRERRSCYTESCVHSG